MRDLFRRCPTCGFPMTSRIIPTYGMGWTEEWICPRGHSPLGRSETRLSDSSVPSRREAASSGTEVKKGETND